MEDKAANQFTDVIKYATFQPFKLRFFEKTIINYIACSYNHAIAITTRGSAYCWGENEQFQLGLGFSSDYVATPIRLLGALE